MARGRLCHNGLVRHGRAVGRLVAAAAAGLVLAAVTAGAETPLPPERLRDSGLEAWDGGRYLTAYARLAQYLARAPGAADRPVVEERMARAREALMSAAPRRSLVVATVEQRRDRERPPERAVARLVAQDGRVTVESTRGPGPGGARWQRAGAAAPEAYAAFVGRLLDAPAFRVHLPQQPDAPDLPGPRRAVALRIEVGDEVWEGQALRGEPYDKLVEAAARVLDFARSTPLAPQSDGAGGARS